MLYKAPMTKAESLALVAYRSLVANGNTDDPTLHDVAHAVVQSAPLLNLVDRPDAIDIEMQAIKMLCEENDWANDKKVVISLTHFAQRAERWQSSQR